MPWARLDDQFHSHPTTFIVGLDGCGLFAKALSYAACHLTDGFITEEWVLTQIPRTKRNGDRRNVLDKLVEAGMFEPVAGGYLIAGYLDFNPSREQVLSERDDLSRRRAEAGRKGARARWGDGKHGKPHGKSHGKTDGTC